MNQSQIQVYQFKNSPVRTLMGENGDPWFVAKDVCEILEISNPSDALKRLDDDERARFNLGRQGETNVVNEAGLYVLVLGSRKAEAHEFKRWVTHEVLPTIRKHGAYMSEQTIEQALTSPDFLIKLATQLKNEKEARAKAEAQIEADKPKVLFADAVSASDGTCLVGELAKMITQSYKDHNSSFTIGQNRMFARLRNDGYLGTSGQNKNVPLQRYIEQGLFRIKETAITHPDGHVSLNRTPKVTGRGQRYFLHKYGWKETTKEEKNANS